jgi:tripartite-type tricarboxylate transporter receptor subunit TctC
MKRPWRIARTMPIALAACVAGAAAQDYPTQVVRIFANVPGGVFDFGARVMAQGLSGTLGQSVIVDNRPGNVVPAQIVAKSPPDGHALLFHGQALYIGALLQKVPYDPLADFAPISMVARAPLVLVVHPSIPVRNAQELIALAKRKPGALNYASTGVGATPHLAAELFKYATATAITHIPYKGAGPAMLDLVGGQVHLIFSVPNSALPHIQSGRLRALGVTSIEPSALFPGLPTLAASGVPDYESVGLFGLFAPARTPDAIVRRLHRDTVRLLATADVKKRFLAAGLETVGSTAEEFSALLRNEMVKMERVVKAAHIRLD